MRRKLYIFLLLLSLSSLGTTYTVTIPTGNASWDSPTANNGTFAGAILAINASGTGGHTIAFNLPGPNYTIDIGGMTAALATNTGITIDGFTQSGSVCNTNLLIGFDLNWAVFTISNQTNLTIRGVRFNSGLALSGCTGTKIQGCFFNLNNTGSTAAGTVVGTAQLTVSGCTTTQIGGTGVCEANVFSGATASSNYTSSIMVSANSTGLKIYNNYIGTDRTGLIRLGSLTGVTMDINTSQNVDINGNVISASKGSPGHGINVSGGNCNGLQIKNNKIGLDANGTGLPYSNASTFGNYGSGIYFAAGTIDNAVIDNNDIGSNRMYGIHFRTSHSGVQITNNNIGVGTSGVHSSGNDLGNGFSGICFETVTSTNVTISNNIIVRNGWLSSAPSDQKETCGIVFQQGTVASATISNNRIGVDLNTALAGNEFTGLYFFSCNNMGGSNAANVVVSGNVIGDNGESTGTIINSHGIATYLSNYFTITNNYIGVGTSGENIGNSANGIEVNTSTNFLITGNQIANNKGRRTSAEAEACAGVAMYNSSNGTLYNNTIYNHANAGGGFINNNGVFVQRGGNIRIGGMGANEPNIIHTNGTHAIAVFEGADFVEMRYNSMYCNAAKAINIGCTGSVFGKTPGNNSFGCGTLAISPTPPANPTSIAGNRPTNSIVDVFGTIPCSAGPCVSQGQYRFSGGTYTPAVQGVAGTTWSYNHGSAMYNDLSALATGGSTDCNGSSVCRTSEFSPCVDNPMPVHYLSFLVKRKQSGVEITWSTAMETNSRNFIIERSSDGFSFEPIATVTAAGNSETISNYTFIDDEVNVGTYYYRLRQVDRDGTYSITEIKKISFGETNILVYPNPSEGTFSVLSSKGSIITIQNLVGVTLVSQISNEEVTEFENTLPSGIYLVEIVNGSEKYTEKLIIK